MSLIYKRYTFIGLAATALLAFLYACTKDTKVKPSYPNYTPTVALSDYCFFKLGTWWLYQDSISGAKDCVYVAAGSVQTYTVGPNDGKDYTGTFHHYYTKTIDGIGDEREYDIYDEDAAESAKCCGGRYYCNVAWNTPPVQSVPGIYHGEYVQMFNNFTPGVTGGHGISGSQGDECWARGTSSSLNVSGSNFTDVVIFEVLRKGGLAYPYDSHFKNYISKHIGIIKHVDLDSNRTWLLTSHHISS